MKVGLNASGGDDGLEVDMPQVDVGVTQQRGYTRRPGRFRGVGLGHNRDGIPGSCFEWQEAGVWDRLHQAAVDRLGEQGLPDWSCAASDSLSVRAS